jgi:hypothetical protein
VVVVKNVGGAVQVNPVLVILNPEGIVLFNISLQAQTLTFELDKICVVAC